MGVRRLLRPSMADVRNTHATGLLVDPNMRDKLTIVTIAIGSGWWDWENCLAINSRLGVREHDRDSSSVHVLMLRTVPRFEIRDLRFQNAKLTAEGHVDTNTYRQGTEIANVHAGNTGRGTVHMVRNASERLVWRSVCHVCLSVT